ncbi:G-patch-domain-containing protein [Lophiostoma macrostomum CBS 122681]|uniref:G-patch-domain-containing protein n=1 Tax=Lophiostoma macrostomum CBS 122681 TaxID=1314788 RepID=A0A6A6TVQ1_9PLEO|nr:G-patch-domain-containing protein [Lophiostoma macrostomum CBS 122681]
MAQSDEEEDYMTMTIEEPANRETNMQRIARKRREAQERAYIKPKAEREAEEEAAREASLLTPLPSTNKGFKMMAKMGFKQGDALGKSENARTEPIKVNVKEDKSGIGLESERKRKIREQFEKAERDLKRSKAEDLDYREAQRQQMREKKMESDLYRAQKTTERLDEKDLGGKDPSEIRLKSINLLWRGRERYRREKIRERKDDQQLRNSILARQPTYEDDDEDKDYQTALGREELVTTIDDDLEEEDQEFEEFEALPIIERLEKVLMFLREKHHYCYWCGHQYPNAEMEGCPGLTDDEHD